MDVCPCLLLAPSSAPGFNQNAAEDGGSSKLNYKFLLCLAHRLEGFDGNLQHGRVGFASRQGLQSQIRLDQEAHNGRIQMISRPADILHRDPSQKGNQQDAACQSPKH